jgi:pyruvate kinase
MRLAKIVATLGPACTTPAVLEAMVASGLDVARLNFSHGDAAGHARTARALRAAASRVGRPVAILQDLQGPRIRLGLLPGDSACVDAGSRVDLVPERGAAGRNVRRVAVLPTSYARLAREVRRGERILLRDGSVELRVVAARGARVRCEVVRGGEVRSHSGINVPDSRLATPALTSKDRRDLAAGVRMGVDAVALSFVRDARAVVETKALLRSLGSEALVVAKIERKEALRDLDAIVTAADGVMVARGDLGVELAPEEVPLLQKRIIRHALRAHSFVITATQMLESMVTNATPTRAEVSDVANAVLDGTDAVMLSAETAAGRHPVEAVAAMDRILCKVEEGTNGELAGGLTGAPPGDPLLHALAGAAVRLASQSCAKALVPFTVSGRSAAVLATWRPGVPIFAWTIDERVRRRLCFWRGVHPERLARSSDLAHMCGVASAELLRRSLLAPGDVVVFLGGTSLKRGSSNTLKLHRLAVRDGPAARAGRGHSAAKRTA